MSGARFENDAHLLTRSTWEWEAPVIQDKGLMREPGETR
jgi:hypothetical protein